MRTGLLSVSAAVAVGAVAMATGLLPGGPTLSGSNDPAGGVRADAPTGSGLETQGSPSASPVERGTTPAGRGEDRPQAPSTTPSKTPGQSSSAPSTPSKQPGSPGSGQAGGNGSGNGNGKANGHENGKGNGGSGGKGSSSHKPTTPPGQSTDPGAPGDSGKTAAREVVALVNQERSKVGCEPVTADPKLTQLAQDFTDDMALRGFFDHLDPDGDSPWERAEQVGILNLGGENIARGQQDAQAVMDSWMNSPGHRANILNCSYKSLGVGANFGDGDGPWWTQDFGY